jgi:hypothetical protein
MTSSRPHKWLLTRWFNSKGSAALDGLRAQRSGTEVAGDTEAAIPHPCAAK